MRALDKLENFRAKNLEIFRQKILGNCNGKINSSFLSSIFNGQDVHIYKYVSATFQNDETRSRLGNLLWTSSGAGTGGALTLFEPARADYPHLLLLAPPKFFTFQQHCIESRKLCPWLSNFILFSCLSFLLRFLKKFRPALETESLFSFVP